jgi:hypothetical protein
VSIGESPDRHPTEATAALWRNRRDRPRKKEESTRPTSEESAFAGPIDLTNTRKTKRNQTHALHTHALLT